MTSPPLSLPVPFWPAAACAKYRQVSTFLLSCRQRRRLCPYRATQGRTSFPGVMQLQRALLRCYARGALHCEERGETATGYTGREEEERGEEEEEEREGHHRSLSAAAAARVASDTFANKSCSWGGEHVNCTCRSTAGPGARGRHTHTPK